METMWFLDWSTLPERLLWARLQVADDGTVVVLDLDGVHHRFADLLTAKRWLNEDEYGLLSHLVEDGVVDASVIPPTAASDQELVSLMVVELTPDSI